jgi:hypothetical protein
MLVYIDRKIIDTYVCEVVEEYPQNDDGFYDSEATYITPCGFEFRVKRSITSGALRDATEYDCGQISYQQGQVDLIPKKIPQKAQLELEFSNIGVGVSSCDDVKYREICIYKTTKKYYAYVNYGRLEEPEEGEISLRELEGLLIEGFESWQEVKCLEYMVENRELFKDIEFIV